MIKTLFYTILIMGLLGLMLFLGLYAPDPIGKIARSVVEYLNWKPINEPGPFQGTQEKIKQFNQSFHSMKTLLQMTLKRNQQAAQDLEVIHKATGEKIKEILSPAQTQSVLLSGQLLDEVRRLHEQRRVLIENIINDERLLINLNDQVEQQINAVTQWMSEQDQKLSQMSARDILRVQKYEDLRNNFKFVHERSGQLDDVRRVFLKENKEFVDVLKVSNQQLEDLFRVPSSTAEAAVALSSQNIWREYQQAQSRQEEIVRNMQTNQDLIEKNQQQMASVIEGVGARLSYNPIEQSKKSQEDSARNTVEFMRSSREQADDQRRSMDLRVRDQMQRIRDDQLNRKLNRN